MRTTEEAAVFLIRRNIGAAMAATLVLSLALSAPSPAAGQTFQVLHSFTGDSDGGNPQAGLTLDSGGKLYGTTLTGTVFRLARAGSGWVLLPIFSQVPFPLNAPVVFGPDGTLYGTTYGLDAIVFNLRPPATSCRSSNCMWSEKMLYSNCCFGFAPGGITFDQQGDLYGPSEFEGVPNGCSGGLGCGLIYKMTPVVGNDWNETTIYAFQPGGADGDHPEGKLIFDQQGNIYGTTGGLYEGDGFGTVFELNRFNGWAKTNLYRFPEEFGSEGSFPTGGVVFDQLGNLYGGTTTGGLGGGTVFEMTPSNEGWTYNVIHSFSGSGYEAGVPSSLIRGSDGSLYGVTIGDGLYALGSVFRLTPSNGSWTFTSLHDFTGGSDGAYPYGSLVMDVNGNLYGTTLAGGITGSNCANYYAYQCGVAFEITP